MATRQGKKRGSVKERIQNATKKQWIKFGIVSLLYILFVIWDYNYWLLLGLPIVFDIYISKVIPWGAWKQSENKVVRTIGDWTDAIVFALIAVTFIHIFIFQNYKIPSSSLEKTLLVGDYLFVSKMSYGPRVPNTPLAFPLVHHTIPVLNTKSYSDKPHWDYKRLKGFGEVKRNDIVVFNYPAGDTVALNAQNYDYYWLVKANGWDVVNKRKDVFGDVVYRPVDRRENYVKRCVGLPGETLKIEDNQVYIDGEQLPFPKYGQLNYYVETHGRRFTDKQFKELGVNKDDQNWIPNNEFGMFNFLGIIPNETGNYNPTVKIPLTNEALQILKDKGWAKSIIKEPSSLGGEVYPYDIDLEWDRDNYGPIWIPQKGKSIQLNPINVALYRRCIINYEGNSLRKENGTYYLNDQPATSYTFKYDYYWMMGDNRHNSADSRSWGFVPEDHIVGQPIVVWFSTEKDNGLFDGGIRWKRLFSLVKNQT